MIINHLKLRNFKKFDCQELDFRHQGSTDSSGSFHVLIGKNGSGKSSILDALAISLGIWQKVSPTAGWRQILSRQRHLITKNYKDSTRFDVAGETSISVGAEFGGSSHSWLCGFDESSGETRFAPTSNAFETVWDMIERSLFHQGSQSGKEIPFPVLAYYGAGRAWLPPKERSMNEPLNFEKVSRFDAYENCLDGRVKDEQINHWFLFESVEAFQRGKKRIGREAVENAILGCFPDAKGITFDADRKEIVIQIDKEMIPYSNLSDGQRAILSVIADLAIRAALLNPMLGEECVTGSPGVVLIDELDLHLHPTWQREIVENLRKAFPRIQFIATTHSPFIIQTLRQGELVSLDQQPIPGTDNIGIETIAKGLMGVPRPDVSPRYSEMKSVARSYLEKLDHLKKTPKEKLAGFEEELAAQIEPYADNPAFQAFLEMKKEVQLSRIDAE